MDRILIVGGVAAGLSAASRVRRLAPDARITVVERGPAAGYSACGLSHFLSGRVDRLDRLLSHPLEVFCTDRRLDVQLETEALEIEPARHRVRVRQGVHERWLAYDRLVIATGAEARWRPAVFRNLFRANTWAQAEELDQALRSGEFRRWAVVGGGYIGCQMAEAMARRGVSVTLVHAHAALLRSFEPELVAELPRRFESQGITVRMGARVRELDGARGGKVLALETSDGRIEADAVLNCAGLQPAISLAKAAGIALGVTGAIAVDERQQTNISAVFAAGDCAETRHVVTQAPTWVPLAAAANKQGRVAGANASGHGRERFPGVLATLAVPLGGIEWGRTGLTLDQARTAGYPAVSIEVTAGSQAGYLSPAPVTVTIVAESGRGRLLGCHLRGAPGTVAGRLDTAATALTAGMTLEQIEGLDLAYAPDLGPLYEPLLIAAHNALRQ